MGGDKPCKDSGAHSTAGGLLSPGAQYISHQVITCGRHPVCPCSAYQEAAGKERSQHSAMRNLPQQSGRDRAASTNGEQGRQCLAPRSWCLLMGNGKYSSHSLVCTHQVSHLDHIRVRGMEDR